MQFLISVVLILCLFSSSHLACAHDERSVYIVHMDKSSMPKPFSTHTHWYSSILNSLDQNPIYTYDNAFHGFSASLSKQELETLKTSQGFLSAYPDFLVKAETTRSTGFLSLSSATGLWPASEYGKDVIIGIVDSGIWPESPSFSDHGMTEIPERWKGICQTGEQFNSSMCNRKIIGARYFNKAFQASNPGSRIAMNSPRDDDGHGSHVASTAAGNFVDDISFFGYANGTARGVAPRARLAVYKVLWNAASDSDTMDQGVNLGSVSDTLAGIDAAVSDGVDVISVSIGGGPDRIQLYDNPLSVASFGARQKGIIICFSGGNRGYSIGSLRSGFPWAVIVAAGTIDRWFAGTLTLANGKSITGWTLFPARANVRNLPIVYNTTSPSCDSSMLSEAGGSIVVCNLSSFDSISFDSVMGNLVNSDVRAAIIISDDATLRVSGSFIYPATLINPIQGQQVIDYISRTTSPRATIDFQQTIIGTGPVAAPALGLFSSRGPAQSYAEILKPDLMAPGVLILAAYSPLAFPRTTIGNNILLSSNYALLWGTSMACPHISGVAALLKAAHPDWSPSAIQSAMMTTANPLNNVGQPIREMDDMIASPLGIGSGHVDPNRALNPGLVYDASPQDFVDLVCSMNFTREQTQTITRSSYDCSNPSSDLNYPSFIATFKRSERGKTLTRIFRRTMTNVGDSAAIYRVKVEQPQNTTVRIRPQTLVFGKKYEKQSYTMSIQFVADVDQQVPSGSLTWTEKSGKYTVRSPIMVFPGNDDSE